MNLDSLLSTGLYKSEFEKDNCGFGMIVNLENNPSHKLLENSIQALTRLSHRGARSSDGKSGDGCGLLLSIPQDFFRKEMAKSNQKLNKYFAVGHAFLTDERPVSDRIKNFILNEATKHKLEIVGWRVTPTDKSCLGEQALKKCPHIEQVFINKPDKMSILNFERKLYLIRRVCEKVFDSSQLYFSSLSSQIICYKGLVIPEDLSSFYKDLNEKSFRVTICMFHQRFSTNTLPEWRLAQPFRYLAHNGEINTVQGNRNWINSQKNIFLSDDLRDYNKDIFPVVSKLDSDSCSLDNALEYLYLNGMELYKAMRIMIPPAWQNVENLDPDLKAFYEYYAMHMGAWDGPAGIVASDGKYAICALDRNGLRPARWVSTIDGNLTIASEIGVYDYSSEDVVTKGRVGPGEIMVIDLQQGRIMDNHYINSLLKSRKPYKKWLQKNRIYIQTNSSNEDLNKLFLSPDRIKIYQKMFGVSYEEQEMVIKYLANKGTEAIGSMGDDTPIAILSNKTRSIYDYFRQQFAQVTNPPIDPIRERIVMSLKTYIGNIGNIFDESEVLASRIVLDSPILTEVDFSTLVHIHNINYPCYEIKLNYSLKFTLKEAVEDIVKQGISAIKNGYVILILNDEYISPDTFPVHALLATGAVHHALINKGLRSQANLIVKTATARDSHHMATLLGYGATAIFPYLAYQIISQLFGKSDNEIINKQISLYTQGLRKGLLKIMSKMGIATMTSYRGAQLFEIIGLADEVVRLCFTGTISRFSGVDFALLLEEQLLLVRLAYKSQQSIEHGGKYKYVHGGEYHAFNPSVMHHLHKALNSGLYSDYKVYSQEVNDRPISMIRDMLKLKIDKSVDVSIDISEVESASSILKRFDGAGMSLGALSPEAHESIAAALNRLGAKSNSGEGGEDKNRYGTERRSKIKQVASGRFGVTPEYLMSAEVIQIKISQGAKPGEGGQLPGHKVTPLIAKLRYATEGVTLISPPPHHDIYSIEDLAQLIYDLKTLNPDALVSVKLVSEAGIGTIAAGVVKAAADLITISGHDGGTGASPLSSIAYAGTPWEIGLSETQQILCANNLRSRVRLQVDGGLKTGLDIIKATILGAESFGFGSIPMIALGCKYLRVCHLNNCATGVATQNQVLRDKYFKGNVEKIMNYFSFVAQDVREILAQLGISKLEELIGRVDLLEPIKGNTQKQRLFDLSRIIDKPIIQDNSKPYCTVKKNTLSLPSKLSEIIFNDVCSVFSNDMGGVFHYEISNTDRSIGANVSGYIAKKFGNGGIKGVSIVLSFIGSAGQSFGVFNVGGVHLCLEGDANDYVGKGMAGGKIIIKSPKKSLFDPKKVSTIGNTCLYGATGGVLYSVGRAGERFAVRNSGAIAVVEGVGDHCCEYMTGGIVIVLGNTGVNFGAGMTGGVSYVLDLDNTFVDNYNHELLNIYRMQTEHTSFHRANLYEILIDYVKNTQSKWGKSIVDNFEDYIGKFWLVVPIHRNIEMPLKKISEIV